jgi:hypothetical protein
MQELRAPTARRIVNETTRNAVARRRVAYKRRPLTKLIHKRTSSRPILIDDKIFHENLDHRLRDTALMHQLQWETDRYSPTSLALAAEYLTSVYYSRSLPLSVASSDGPIIFATSLTTCAAGSFPHVSCSWRVFCGDADVRGWLTDNDVLAIHRHCTH